MAGALRRGIERGDLRPGLDIELALDLLAAPLYYRALFGHARITSQTPADIVDVVLAGPAADERRHDSALAARPVGSAQR